MSLRKVASRTEGIRTCQVNFHFLQAFIVLWKTHCDVSKKKKCNVNSFLRFSQRSGYKNFRFDSSRKGDQNGLSIYFPQVFSNSQSLDYDRNYEMNIFVNVFFFLFVIFSEIILTSKSPQKIYTSVSKLN